MRHVKTKALVRIVPLGLIVLMAVVVGTVVLIRKEVRYLLTFRPGLIGMTGREEKIVGREVIGKPREDKARPNAQPLSRAEVLDTLKNEAIDGQAFSEEYLVTIYPSPDASQAVVRYRHPDSLDVSDVTDLSLIRAARPQVVSLTQDRAGYDTICWSTDGRFIAYTSRQGVHWEHPVEGPNPKIIRWALYVQEIKSGVWRKLYEEPASEFYTYNTAKLSWLKASHSLLYGGKKSGGLWLIHTDSGQRRRITRAEAARLKLQKQSLR